MTPSVTPKTTTRSHSRPFTRWTVDSVTPPGVGLAAGARRAATARSRPGRGGGRPPGAGPRGRRGGSTRPRRPWSGRACSMASPRPMSSRTTSRTWRVVPPARPRRPRREVVGQLARPWSATLSSSTWSAMAAQAADDRRPPPEPLREPLGQAAARPAVDLDEVGRVDVLAGRRRCGGRRGRPACRCARGRSAARIRVDRHARLDQGDVGGEQQRVDPGQHGDRARARRPARPASPAPPRATAAAPVVGRRGGARRSASAVGSASGPGRISLATRAVVVAEQRGGGVDHLAPGSGS